MVGHCIGEGEGRGVGEGEREEGREWSQKVLARKHQGWPKDLALGILFIIRV